MTNSNALARVPDRDAGLSPAGKARMAEIRARNTMVATISAESWGSKISPEQARAYAEYLRRFALDVSEVDILGGKPRRNGQYYKRRIMEMATAGRIESATLRHIGPDARLDKLAASGDAWAKEEALFRERERIKHAVPENAKYAALAIVKVAGLAEPLTGCKWIIPGKTKLGWSKTEKGKREQVPADPVGEENPVETVETRAWARVGKLVAAEIPELRAEQERMDAAERDVQTVVARIVEDEDEREQSARLLPAGAVQRADYGEHPAPTRVAVQPSEGDVYDQPDASAVEEGELFDALAQEGRNG